VQAGLPTEGMLATKLWLVAKTLHLSPFSDDVMGLTLAQLDWCVEMIAKDNNAIKITRNGQVALPESAQKSVRAAAIYDTMRGRKKEQMLDAMLPTELRAALKTRTRQPRTPKLYQANS